MVEAEGVVEEESEELVRGHQWQQEEEEENDMGLLWVVRRCLDCRSMKTKGIGSRCWGQDQTSCCWQRRTE
jgi:hypothetical protein